MGSARDNEERETSGARGCKFETEPGMREPQESVEAWGWKRAARLSLYMAE